MRNVIVKNGVVVNVVLGSSPLAEGETLHEHETASIGWLYDAETGELSAPVEEQPPATKRLVKEERDRRVLAGATINGIPLEGDLWSCFILLSLAFVAQRRQAAGDTTPQPFVDADDGAHQLTPAQVLALFDGAFSHIMNLYGASWLLRAQNPIPTNYTSDQHWP